MSRAAKIAWLLCSLAICVGAVLMHRKTDQTLPAVPNTELYAVVWQQINAVRLADYSSAYQQVSTQYQERFNIESFTELSRTDYPDLRLTDHIEFGDVQVARQRALVHVYFVLREGEVVPCIFSLIREESGWKIDGAKPQRRWPSSQRLGGIRS